MMLDAPTHKEATAYMIDVMLAYVDGKEIEARDVRNMNWQTCGRPAWNWTLFEYRIATPKPDEVHWIALNEKFEWVARDEDGSVWAFPHEPELTGRNWTTVPSSGVNITNIIAVKVGSLPWTKSKQKRPDGQLIPFTFDDGLAALGLAKPPPPRR